MIKGELRSPPGLQWEVEILSEVEDVERQPADDEETDGGYEEVTPPDVPLLLLQPPVIINTPFLGEGSPYLPRKKS